MTSRTKKVRGVKADVHVPSGAAAADKPTKKGEVPPDVIQAGRESACYLDMDWYSPTNDEVLEILAGIDPKYCKDIERVSTIFFQQHI